MKKFFRSAGLWLLALPAMMLATSCDELSDENNGCGSSNDNSAIWVEYEGDILFDTVDGPESCQPGAEARVSFNHFPNTLDQFKAILPTLKERPSGAVVAELMAMELYRRNRKAGEKAFKLCGTLTCVSAEMERMPDLFGYTGTLDESYARPYQVASFLKGATPQNGYSPDQPYTVVMKVSSNGAVYSEFYQSYIVHLLVDTSGAQIGYRGCEVVNTLKSDEPSGWVMQNCPGLYTQCQQVSYSNPFTGLK